MRAKEFLPEAKVSQDKISKRDADPAHAIDTYSDAEHWSGDYVSYRLGMAVACTDGKIDPWMDAKSWIGKAKSTHPYTAEEQAMLKKAYKAVGAKHKTVAHPGSQELPDTQAVSPVAAFKKKK